MKQVIFAIVAAGVAVLPVAGDSVLTPISLKSAIANVQPMTGIVFWEDSGRNETDAIQLEFCYMRYSDVVVGDGKYDWSAVEKRLAAIAGRRHQAILRFYDAYPGRPTAVPDFLKAQPDYRETHGTSEKQATDFPDWSHAGLKRFIMDFHTQFAKRYDRDPRLAFLQVGFGLWSEYHIYDGPFELGRTFPDHAYQAEFLHHLATTYRSLPWSISVDAAGAKISPIVADPELQKLPFGVFDDSFLCAQHAEVNARDWQALDRRRYLRQPAGGEFSYYTTHDQKHALAPKGPHGVRFEKAARAFHISYMIGSDQPEYQSMKRIREAGLGCGYKFRIVEFRSAPGKSKVRVENTGVAPIYRDAFVTVNGVRAGNSLRGLAPGKSASFVIAAGGKTPELTITSDHLVPGQVIGFEADLK